MKIAGKIFSGPRVETLVLPRQDGDTVIKARAVLNFDDFDVICKEPKPPLKMVPGGGSIPLLTDKDYAKKLELYAERQTHWMILRSLEATEGLQWDTIDATNPATWGNYRKEMTDAGFSFAEINMIVRLVIDACGLNQAKIEEATKRFLAGQEVQPVV